MKDTLEFWSKPEYAQIIRNLKDKYGLNNWALCFNETSIEEIAKIEKLLKDCDFVTKDGAKIDYFYKAAISNYEQLEWIMLTTRVSDIYITSPLAFDVENLKKVFKRKYISKPLIRIYPNVCQSILLSPSIRTFFIRPEDLHLYEKYIDVAEIYVTDLQQKKNANVYFNIYNKSKTWMGDLQEYLIDCEDSIDNLYIFNGFGEQRLSCQHKCSQGRCNMCNNQKEYIDLMNKTHEKIFEISEKIEKMGLDTKNEDDVENIREYIGETDKEAEYYEECDRD